MSVPTLQKKVKQHWAKWLPKRTAELKAEGLWEEATHGAARTAQVEIDHLMNNLHFRLHEAEEVALKNHVLLPPETGAELEDWEAKELAGRETQYRKMMRRTL